MISNWSVQPPRKTRARQAGSITTSKIDKIISQSCINSMVSPCFRFLHVDFLSFKMTGPALEAYPRTSGRVDRLRSWCTSLLRLPQTPDSFPSFPKSPFLSSAPEKRQTQMLNAGILECRPCVKLKDFKESGPQRIPASGSWHFARAMSCLEVGHVHHAH